MVESPMSPQAIESRSLPPLYLIEAATERLTIEVCVVTVTDSALGQKSVGTGGNYIQSGLQGPT